VSDIPASIRTTRFTDEHVFKTTKILGFIFITAQRNTRCRPTSLAVYSSLTSPGFYYKTGLLLEQMKSDSRLVLNRLVLETRFLLEEIRYTGSGRQTCVLLSGTSVEMHR